MLRISSGGYATVAAVAAANLLVACATVPDARRSGPPAESSDYDAGNEDVLGLSGRDVPLRLEALGNQPYLLSADMDCKKAAAEIARLDQVLGPDVDTLIVDTRTLEATRFVTGAVRGAIPYRWVVRWMTRADKRDRAFQAAVLVGMTRRAFLKGLRAATPCPPPPVVLVRPGLSDPGAGQ